MRWGGIRCVEIFFGRSGKSCSATLAAEVENLAVVNGLRYGAVGVNRHPADGISFGGSYVLLHFVRHAEGFDSSVGYKTLVLVESPHFK